MLAENTRASAAGPAPGVSYDAKVRHGHQRHRILVARLWRPRFRLARHRNPTTTKQPPPSPKLPRSPSNPFAPEASIRLRHGPEFPPALVFDGEKCIAFDETSVTNNVVVVRGRVPLTM
jgi:hypothetical protein